MCRLGPQDSLGGLPRIAQGLGVGLGSKSDRGASPCATSSHRRLTQTVYLQRLLLSSGAPRISFYVRPDSLLVQGDSSNDVLENKGRSCCEFT